MVFRSEFFYGNEVSEYGKEHGFVDYGTLAKSFNHVCNNEIIKIGNFEQISGFVDNSDQIEELEEQIEKIEEQIEELEEKQEELMEDIEESETEKELEALEIELEKMQKKSEKMEDKIIELENEIADLRQEEDYSQEIFQYYIVDDNGASILEEANEIVFYNEEFDIYIWGVTHWGTSWDYVLTNIRIEKEED